VITSDLLAVPINSERFKLYGQTQALATSLGIAGKWKPKEFLEKAAAHLGEPVPRGKVQCVLNFGHHSPIKD
jgi:hypothetical protein